MRENCCTAESPPKMTPSSASTWPASAQKVATMQRSPSWQSWATWAEAMMRHWLASRVTPPPPHRAGVDRGELADQVFPSPISRRGVLAAVLEVLRRRRPPRRGRRCGCPRRAWCCPSTTAWAPDRVARAHADLGADDGVGADLAARVDLRARRDDGGGVDGHGQPSFFRSTSMAMNSASATTSPSTRALPFCFQMAPLCFTTSTCSSSRSPGTTGLRKRALSMPMR